MCRVLGIARRFGFTARLALVRDPVCTNRAIRGRVDSRDLRVIALPYRAAAVLRMQPVKRPRSLLIRDRAEESGRGGE